MNGERWQRIQLLTEEALAQPQGARDTFVKTACGEDVALRDEVASLLAACERSPETQLVPATWFGLLADSQPPRFRKGEQIAGRYRVQRLLGRGGMGEVYEAWDEELSIPVALKTLHLPGRTEEAHKRLKLEGILARSIWHPNVCRLYDLGRHVEGRDEGEDSTWFLTMELLRGETLSRRLHDEGRLPLDRARRLAEQMAAGLGAAHQAGIVHRDFKTSNIMLVTVEGDEQAVVTDFGIARAAQQGAEKDDPQPASGSIAGTPAYMAPEQVRGEDVGPAADIYALGIVLYEMVTGTVPFTGDSAMEVARRRLLEDPPSPRRIVPDLDERWEAVILRCLAREPGQRFGRAEEVAGALAGQTTVAKAASLDVTAGAWHSLPAERDPFVGREMESRDLESAFAGGSRLVTLVGAGGMGKTRLAVHYGWRRPGKWPGGVWFCDLTDARSVNGIASAIAGSLGVQLGRGDPIDQLGHAIAGRGRCLMILDNFEQVVDHAGETVGRWIERAGEARFLVTSREKLGLGDQEMVQAVGPLSAETGMELWTVRVRRLHPGLDLAGLEGDSARLIVRLVDGMPLAIELAAARMRVMSAAQIVAQMRRRFSLLTGGGSARHETLVVALDGSWELLKPWEQSAWAQCSVFEGGFTLEAAEDAIDLGVWPEAPWIVDVLQSLVDKSLLRTWVPAAESGEEVPEARFGMFVSLQEYARMKLREDPSLMGAADGTPADLKAEQRHGHWYARYGTPEGIKPFREGPPKKKRQVERELDNLVAACRRAVQRGDAATAVATFRASWAILGVRGPFGVAVSLGREVLGRLRLGQSEEGHVLKTLGIAEWYSGMVDESRAHQDAALAIAREVPDRHLEALVLLILGSMQISQGQADQGSVYLEMALEAARAVGDRYAECNALDALGVTRRGQGRMAEAGAYSEAALALARLAGYPALEGALLNNLGVLLQHQGHTEEARVHYEAALAALREVGSRRTEGDVRGNLGRICHGQGRMEDARVHMEAALAIYREMGARLSEGTALFNLGLICHTQERPEEARAHYEAALAIERELGNRRVEGHIIGALGRLHQDRGEVEPARALYESALSLHREMGDRRSEGGILARIASLLHRQGSIEAARDALASGEALLRELEDPLELGRLLCIRAEVEYESGVTAAARAAIEEAEGIALRIGSGPDSELGRMIEKVRGGAGFDARPC